MTSTPGFGLITVAAYHGCLSTLSLELNTGGVFMAAPSWSNLRYPIGPITSHIPTGTDHPFLGSIIQRNIQRQLVSTPNSDTLWIQQKKAGRSRGREEDDIVSLDLEPQMS